MLRSEFSGNGMDYIFELNLEIIRKSDEFLQRFGLIHDFVQVPKQHCSENGDYGNDNKQFDQSETRLFDTGKCLLCF